MEETLNLILKEIKEMRLDINELKQGQTRLEICQGHLQKNKTNNP